MAGYKSEMEENKDGMAVNCYFFEEKRGGRGYRCKALIGNGYKNGRCTGCPFFRTEENFNHAQRMSAENWGLVQLKRKIRITERGEEV